MADKFNVQLGVVYDQQQAKSELERQIKSLQQNSKLALKMEISDKEAEQAIKSQTKAWSQYRKEAVQAITAPNVELQKMKQMYKDQESDIQKNIKAQKQLYIAQEEAIKINERMNQSRIKSAQQTEQTSKNFEKLNYRIQAFTKNNPKAVKTMGNEFEALRQKVLNASKSADPSEYKKLSNSFSTLQSQAKAFGNTGNTVFSKVSQNIKNFANYMVSATVAMTTLRTATAAVDTVKELDKAIVDLQMATGQSRAETQDLMTSYINLGKQLGATGLEVSAAASDYLRQGKSVAETNKLITDSIVLSKIGNIDSATATTALTTAMKGYGVEVDNVIGIVDKLSAVDMVSATSAGGLASAMQETATNANMAGVSMDKLLGYLAVVGETTGAAMSSVGNSFSTMFSRMANIKLKRLVDPEAAEDLNNVETSLANVDIKLRSDNQTFRDFSSVLDDVAGKWSTLSEVNQRAIAVSVAGKDHMEDFLVLMQNYGKATEYTNVSLNSSGKAMEKFAAAEEGIEAKSKKLTDSLEQLAQDTLNSSLIKGFYDGSSAIIDFIDKTGLLTETLSALAIIGVAMASKAVIAFTVSVAELAIQEIALASSTGILSGAMAVFNTVMALNPILGWATIILGVTVAFTGLTKALGDNTNSLKDQQEITAKLSSEFDELESKISKINDQLATTQDRIDELNHKEDLTFVEQEELDKLLQTNEQLRIQRQLLKTQADEKQQQVNESIKKEVNKKYGSESHTEKWIQEAGTAWYDKSKFVGTEQEYIDYEIKRIKELNALKEQGKDLTEGEQKEYDKIKSYLTNVGVDYANYAQQYTVDDDAKKSWMDLASTINQVLNPEKYKQNTFDQIFNSKDFQTSKTELEKLSQSGKLTPEVLNSTEQYKSLMDKTGYSAAEVASNINAIYKNTEKATDEVENLSSATETTTEDFLKTKAALDETASMLYDVNEQIEKSGTISTDSLQKILTKYSGMAPAIEEYQNGLMSSEDLFKELEKYYQNDADNYLSLQRKKLENSNTFWNTLVLGNKQLEQGLISFYGNDYKNFSSVADAKIKLTTALVTKLAGIWQNYSMYVTKTASGMYSVEEATNPVMQGQTSGFGGLPGGVGIPSLPTKQGLINQAASSGKLAQAKQITDEYNSLLNSLNSGISGNLSGTNLDWKTLGNLSEAASSTSKAYDMIARAVQRVSDTIANLGKVVSNTYRNWSSRNSALSNEMNAVYEQISNQQQAYQAYMNLANSVGLDEGIASMIRNGSMGEFTTSDEALQSQIDKYTSYYDSAKAAANAVEDLKQQLGDLAKTKFDNVSSQYESRLQQIKHMSNMLNNEINLAEKRGYAVSGLFYQSLIDVQQQSIDKMKEEQSALTASLQQGISSGVIEMYSEAWTTMDNQINSVEESIKDATSSLEEYISALRKVEWDKFDYIRNSVSEITSEAEFLIDLVDNKSTTGKSGLTNEGNAVAGLRALNYNTYMNQADEYRKAVVELNTELAKDPYNQTLIDRRNELLKLQRESITSAESEKSAIKDLIQSGYDAEKSALQDLIDAKKSYNDTINDEYDYQKTLTEQTKAISEYKKQLEAYKNDMSEDVKSKVQTITVSLKEAQETLAETERQKAISDQEKLLDNLMSDADALFNARMDNIDGLIDSVIQQTNANASQISSTIGETTKAVGYTISENMSNIWKGDGGVTSVISKYGTDFLNSQTNLQNVLSGIKSGVDGMYATLNAQAAAAAAKATAQNTYTPPSDTIYSGEGNYTPSEPSGGGGGNSGDFFIYSPDYFEKSALNIEESLVDRLKLHDFDSSFDARAYYYEKMGLGSASDYYGDYDQNVAELQWLKNSGYKNGVKSTGINETNWVHENELVIRPNDNAFLTPLNGGSVFNKSQTDYLWDLSKNKSSLLNNATVKSNGTGSNVFAIDVDEINMTGVNDPQQFTNALLSTLSENAMVKRAVSEVAIGVGLGNNSLKINSFR